jgi:hypothetical protein
MTPKPIKYELHIRGKSSSFRDTKLSIDLCTNNPFPTFRVGDYIMLQVFDAQYEVSDRAVVIDTAWDFSGNPKSPEIHQFVTIREETSVEAIERKRRNKELDE